ncbi:MAG: PadR family transcriptional regulator [Saccharofermentanales bacterium]
MNTNDELMSNLILELRRGTLVLSVLSQLLEPQYGYSLVQSLEEKGLTIDPGTLYPLLRRLEKQDLLISEWEISGTKPRKYYRISDTGKEIFRLLCIEWETVVSCTSKMLQP